MGRRKQRTTKRTEWPNWKGGIPDAACIDDLTEGRSPCYCIDCDEWFDYAWGKLGAVTHRACGGDFTHAL